MERKITRRDRKVWRRNALKGTLKWSREKGKIREKQLKRKKYGWGFNGKSPRTKQRRHKKALAYG